jgi:hypothetical protein
MFWQATMFSFSSLWLCLSLLSFASRATTHPTDISSSLSRLRSELFRPENRFLGQLRHRDDDDDDGAEYGDYGGGYGEYSEGADEAYSETTDDPAGPALSSCLAYLNLQTGTMTMAMTTKQNTLLILTQR